MGTVRRVGVIGGGLAGLAAAVAATRAGAHVEVFETACEPSSPHVHIDLVPNLLRDLVELGVGEACVRNGFAHKGPAVLDGDGRPQFEMPAIQLAGAAFPPSLGMMYADLLRLLREAALGHGVLLHFNRKVLDAFDDGALVTTDGKRHATDLTIIASGTTLPLLAGRAARPLPLVTMPQQWCHALLPRPHRLERSAWILGKAAAKAMVVPIDTWRAGVAVLQPAGADTSPPHMREALTGQGSWLHSLASRWKDGTASLVRPVVSAFLEGPWHEHGVLRIGDSAHVLPPHFGQAAAQALEDAVVLGDLLRQPLTPRALGVAFMRRRGERARQVHAIATQAARWDLQPEAATDLPALARRLAPLVARPA